MKLIVLNNNTTCDTDSEKVINDANVVKPGVESTMHSQQKVPRYDDNGDSKKIFDTDAKDDDADGSEQIIKRMDNPDLQLMKINDNNVKSDRRQLNGLTNDPQELLLQELTNTPYQ